MTPHMAQCNSPYRMPHVVITTVREPTASVISLARTLAGHSGVLVVAGDRKGPSRFVHPDLAAAGCPIDFLSFEAQVNGPFSLGKSLPAGHYSRKNIGYLHAIAAGAGLIYETDDDNAPNAAWKPREEWIGHDTRVVHSAPDRWVNVYRYFSQAHIWPRGFPLDAIRDPVPPAVPVEGGRRAPVQQGLVDGSPDVDAIWRLTMDRPFEFDPEASVYLEPGNWCPFNTQSTWWWPVAYPLLYVPSHCSFRMCDIWKSFIAQRCLWELGCGVAFHPAEVVQDRNEHDLMKDFEMETVGYLRNREIAALLSPLSLKAVEAEVGNNLLRCYETLARHGVFPMEELTLVRLWMDDLGKIIDKSMNIQPKFRSSTAN